jgi:hypothetical protein
MYMFIHIREYQHPPTPRELRSLDPLEFRSVTPPPNHIFSFQGRPAPPNAAQTQQSSSARIKLVAGSGSRELRVRRLTSGRVGGSLSTQVCVYVHVYVYVCMYVCMFIYIYIVAVAAVAVARE